MRQENTRLSFLFFAWAALCRSVPGDFSIKSRENKLTLYLSLNSQKLKISSLGLTYSRRRAHWPAAATVLCTRRWGRGTRAEWRLWRWVDFFCCCCSSSSSLRIRCALNQMPEGFGLSFYSIKSYLTRSRPRHNSYRQYLTNRSSLAQKVLWFMWP